MQVAERALLSRREWLAREPFTLCLSAGFFGFFAHVGLLEALEAAGLRPRRVVGVSAGALAGGLWAAGLPAGDLREELARLRRSDFWDPAFPWRGGLVRGDKFEAVLTRLLGPTGVRHIEDCPLPFTTLGADLLGRGHVLDRGPLSSAIRASCAVPLLFAPVRHAGRRLLDGGLADGPGLTLLAPGERALLHHLQKQAPGPTSTRLVLAPVGLPQPGPFALEEGLRAREAARAGAERWLCAPAAEAVQSPA